MRHTEEFLSSSIINTDSTGLAFQMEEFTRNILPITIMFSVIKHYSAFLYET
jgi:hypothetical protein